MLTYRGNNIEQRSDGYVNLGQLCACYKRRFSDWLRLKNSKGYLTSAAEMLTQSGTRKIVPDELVVSATDEIGGSDGTWGHPIVAVEVARWLSPSFGLWANAAIQAKLQPHKIPATYADALIEAGRLAKELEILHVQTAELQQQNASLVNQIEDALTEYSSIIRVAKHNNVSENIYSWQKLKSAALYLGENIKTVPCPRYGTKNLYSHKTWQAAYPGISLPETKSMVHVNS